DKDGNVKVDGKVRTDEGFPVGLMDVVTIDKSRESYRVLYDVSGRFVLKSIKPEEAKFKLVKVT
ncbi:30S ribosomal protein S4e, partial [Yangia sp. PrR004]|nr:30S ribosomal protein S4e [Salipiger sp. PrR004]